LERLDEEGRSERVSASWARTDAGVIVVAYFSEPAGWFIFERRYLTLFLALLGISGVASLVVLATYRRIAVPLEHFSRAVLLQGAGQASFFAASCSRWAKLKKRKQKNIWHYPSHAIRFFPQVHDGRNARPCHRRRHL
jgi:hypothetical protein